MEVWWKKWPGRLEFELAELKKNNIKYEFDNEAFEKDSVVLNLLHKLDNQQIHLVAKFPDLYPYFRFEVSAPDLNLSRHQVPFLEKNLCLIGRATANWNPQGDNLAKFIIEQLPKVIASASGGEEKLEEQQGEPISDYYPYCDCMIMIDSAWTIDPGETKGTLTIGMDSALDTHRMGVIKVVNSVGKVLAEADLAIADLYSHKRFQARWVREDTPIKIGEPEKFFQYLLSRHPDLNQFSWKHAYGPGMNYNYDLVGITFPEEIGYKRHGDGWIFILILRKKNKESRKGKWKYHYIFARAGRAGRKDMLVRIPNLAFLAKKKVGIVGLGSIGAPSAIEFARSGIGELRLLDNDYVDPGTVVRWPLGYHYVSIFKPDALKYFISHNYPHTKVIPLKHKLGIPVSEKQQTLILEEFLDGIDLLYDASAEIGVHHLLADLAQEYGIPFVIASGTDGAWGGLVARFIPKKGCPCWQCFERAITEKKVPLPPEDPNGSVQPIGCGNPTFTGSNFDLQEVVLSGVRLAISTLARGSSSSYPVVDWNAAILSLRNEDNPLLPQWTLLENISYPDCSCGEK